MVAYESCSIFNDIENTKNIQSKYAQVTQDILQVKSLIVIRENVGSIEIIQNTFFKNSAVKGVIYIENLLGMEYVLIHGNTFNYTATFFDASAIFIRSKYTAPPAI